MCILKTLTRGGIVFYANYLKYLERARTEMMRSLGFEVRSELKSGVNFVVTNLVLDYKRSAKLDDVVFVSAELVSVGASRMEFRQQVWRKKSQQKSDQNVAFERVTASDVGDLVELVSAKVMVACVSSESGKPVRLTEPMRQALITKS